MTTYGHFDEQDQFVISNPYIPDPWLHYLIRVGQPGTETFCSGVTHAGGGFDVRGTHENTFVDTQIHLNEADRVGRYIYVKDTATGEIFSLTWQPVRHPRQTYRTTFGFGRLLFESECGELQARVEMFIPRQFDGWIQNAILQNASARTRKLEIYPFLPIHMGDALGRLLAGDNSGFFGGAAFDRELQAIVFRCHGGISVGDDPEKINGMLGNVAAFYSTLNTPETDYETSLERFLGDRFHTLADPRALTESKLSSRDQADLRRTCGVFRHEVSLAPGQSIEFAVALAAGSTQDYYLKGKNQLKGILSSLRQVQSRREMLTEVTDWWKDYMGRLTIRSPEERLNRAFPWLQYQCQIVYVLNRMKSRFHTGYEYGWGFRDILQDVLFNMAYDPPAVAAALKHISTQMFSNGVAYHNFFIDQPGNKSVEASDDPIWFANAVIRYCKETGDFAFLDEETDYAEVREGQPEKRGSILEHCLRGVDRVWTDRSRRGLPFLKDCDWNDDLNEGRTGGKPNRRLESVMVAQQLYGILHEMIGLFQASGKGIDLVDEYGKRAETLRSAIQAYCLDDEGYYKRVLSLDPDFEELGSSKSQFGKIFLEPQCFSILCGVADEQQAGRSLTAVEKYLDTEYGAMLCTPVFTDLAQRGILPRRKWGIEKEPPAVKENGSIFMHLNGWLVQAYALVGNGRKAVELFLKTLPENLSTDQDRYRAEPFVYPEFVHGRGAAEFGRGSHTWLTGTAPTMHQALTETIFGLRPDYDGLIVEPCVDPAWTDFAATRTFRGATYQFHFDNSAGVERGVRSISVDEKPVPGNKLPLFRDGKIHQIEVQMGNTGEKD